MTPIVLPPRLDTAAAAPLADALRGARAAGRASPKLDGGGVEMLGAACLQVLLAAAGPGGDGVALLRPSAALGQALRFLGAGHLLPGADAAPPAAFEARLAA